MESAEGAAKQPTRFKPVVGGLVRIGGVQQLLTWLGMELMFAKHAVTDLQLNKTRQE